MSSVFFTSDPHFGHVLVAEDRGFVSTDDHDEIIINNFIQKVGWEDKTYFLGDLSGGSDGKTRRALDIIRGLPGKKVLIPGNHCPVHPMHCEFEKWIDEYVPDPFLYVMPYIVKRYDGKKFLFNHFPSSGDHTDKPRYKGLRMSDWEEWRLHGHTHSRDKGSGKEIHVGLDSWNLFPVSINEILDEVKKREQEGSV